jgi:hypothetical protein
MRRNDMVDPNDFSIIIIGGIPESRDIQVQGVLEGSLGGPDTHLDISFELFAAPELAPIFVDTDPVNISLEFGDPGSPVPGTQLIGLAASDDWLLV